MPIQVTFCVTLHVMFAEEERRLAILRKEQLKGVRGGIKGLRGGMRGGMRGGKAPFPPGRTNGQYIDCTMKST